MTAIEFLKKRKKFSLVKKEFDKIHPGHRWEFETFIEGDMSLASMFTWDDTEQKHEYWSKLNDELYLINKQSL